MTYSDDGGLEVEIDTMGGLTFYGQYFELGWQVNLVLPYPEIVNKNTNSMNSTITLEQMTSHGRVRRFVYIDDKGYLRVDMYSELYYDSTNKKWLVGDVTQQQ